MCVTMSVFTARGSTPMRRMASDGSSKWGRGSTVRAVSAVKPASTTMSPSGPRTTQTR